MTYVQCQPAVSEPQMTPKKCVNEPRMAARLGYNVVYVPHSITEDYIQEVAAPKPTPVNNNFENNS